MIIRRCESAYDSVKFTSWKDSNLQNEIRKAIEGVTIDKSSTTDNELHFEYKGKKGSIKMQGYMLALDFDLDDGKPATMYPLKDKKTATIAGVLDTIKTTFSRQKRVESFRRNSLRKEKVCCEDSQITQICKNIEYDKDKIQDILENDLIPQAEDLDDPEILKQINVIKKACVKINTRIWRIMDDEE